MDRNEALVAVADLQAAMRQKDRKEVNRACERLIDGRAPMGRQWKAIATVLQHNGEVAQARRAANLWYEQSGHDAAVGFDVAAILAQAASLKAAAAVLDTLPDSIPDRVGNAYLRGTLAMNLGDVEGARAHLRRAVTLDPLSGQAWIALAMAGRIEEDDIAALVRAGEDIGQAPESERAAYLYALGKAHEQQGRHDDAFAAFSAGAGLMQKDRLYDHRKDQADAEDARSGWDREAIDGIASSLPPVGPSRPIFVTGLPRSGTTLIEQILASHSSVADGEELGLFRLLEQDIGGKTHDAFAAYVDRGGSAEDIRATYDHLLGQRYPGGARIVDKSMNTSRYLGLVAALFPDAPIIWMRRDPVDCAWSAFRTWFLKGVDWSWSFADIAAHFRIEDALLDHWRALLGDRILIVDYAALVSEPETQIRRIVGHCGLDFEPAQLTPHHTERSVTTASVTQVREPINRKGIGSAAPYRRFMDAFVESYGRDAEPPLSSQMAIESFKDAQRDGNRKGIARGAEAMMRSKARIGRSWIDVADLLQSNGEVDLALKAVDELAREGAPAREILYQKAVVASQNGRMPEAEAAIAAIPDDYPNILANAYLKATLAVNRGNFESARDEVGRGTRAAPQAGRLWLVLASTDRIERAEAETMLDIESRMDREPPIERAAIWSTLGSWCHQNSEYDRAFAYFAKAASVHAAEDPYRPEEDRKVAEIAMEWDRRARDRFAITVPEGPPRPIFVTGLPRSGTTLVEQIVCAHSSVDDGRELGLLTHLHEDIKGNEPGDLSAWLQAGHSLNELRDTYLDLLRQRLPGNARVVDKTLRLSRAMGLAQSIFPDAPLVWLRRDPLDCAWSCFRTWFGRRNDWSWTQKGIAEHFRLEDRLVDFWSRELGEKILFVPYRELVEQPAQWTDRISAHCGLSVEPGQYQPHKLNRSVTTASAAQVREPINRKGIGSAEPYREFLEPFFDAYAGKT